MRSCRSALARLAKKLFCRMLAQNFMAVSWLGSGFGLGFWFGFGFG